MFNRRDQEAYMDMIDQHIKDLQLRINAVSQLITKMQDKGERVESQVELLTTIVTLLGALNTIRLETLETLKVNDFRIHRGLAGC